MKALSILLLIAFFCASPPPAHAATVTIDGLEPVEGGKVVFQTIAPPGIGKKAQGRLSIRMRINNAGPEKIKITRIEILGKQVSKFAQPVEVAADSSFKFQNCLCGNSEPLIIDQPFPQTAKIAVFLQNDANPVEKTVNLASHTNDNGPLIYPGKTSDLRTNEIWGASSSHRSDHQVFALDTGLAGWNGNAWSNRRPGKEGAVERESYRIYGMPIYAMADGTVCWALNDHEERPTTADVETISPSLGKFDKEGNHIFVKSGDEIAVYAHLQRGSIPEELLTPNAAVKKGQYLGKVGLSGSSSHPHLHIHVKKEPASGAPDLGKPENNCDTGFFRPMTFKDLQSLTADEATSLAKSGDLDASDWTLLTNHSAPNPRGRLYPSSAAPGFCKTCTDKRQYIGVWRAGNEIDLLVKAEGWDAFTQKWSELSDDIFRLVEINTFMENGKRQFLGYFKKGNDNHFLWNVAGWDAFNGKWKELSDDGLRLIDLATYADGGSRHYVGVFRAGDDGHDLKSITGWDGFTKKWDELGKDGLRLIDLETFPVGNNQRQYIGVFRQGSGRHALWSITGWSSFTSKWDEYSKDGLRLIDVETFAVGNDRQFIGVFRQGGGGHALLSVPGYHRFLQENETQAGKGLRLVDIHVEE